MSAPKAAFVRHYDEFRDCELSKEYYSYRSDLIRQRLKYIDIFLALFAGTSAVLSFSLWDVTFLGFQIGQLALGMLVGLAIIVGIAKPYLKLEDALEKAASIQGGYASLAHMHRDNVNRIVEKKDVDQDAETIFQTLRSFRGMLHPNEDTNIDPAVKKRFSDKVNQRYPKDKFYYPTE